MEIRYRSVEQTRPSFGTKSERSYMQSAFRWIAQLRHPLIIQTIVGLLCVSIAIVITTRLFAPRLVWEDPLAHGLIEMFCALSAACISCCLWMEHCTSARRAMLVNSLAFAVLATGMLTDIAICLFQGHCSFFVEDAETIIHALFSLFTSAILVFAALNHDIEVVRGQHSYRVHLLCTFLVSVLGAIILASEFPRLWARLSPLMPVSGSVEAFMSDQHLAVEIVTVTSLLGFLVAVGANIRSYLDTNEKIYGSLVTFLLFLASAQAFSLSSGAPSDLGWWCGHALAALGLLVLMLRLGAQGAKSYVHAKERIEELETLHTVTSTLNQTLDLRVVLLSFMNDTAKMLHARFAAVMLADPSGETLCTFCTCGLPGSPLSLGCPQQVSGSGRPGFYSGHTARSFRERKVCVVDDVYTDVEFIPWKILCDYDGTSVSIPLVYHGVSLGVINLFFLKNVIVDNEKIKLFETIGSSAAVAIANAQMFDRSIRIETADTQLRPAS